MKCVPIHVSPVFCHNNRRLLSPPQAACPRRKHHRQGSTLPAQRQCRCDVTPYAGKHSGVLEPFAPIGAHSLPFPPSSCFFRYAMAVSSLSCVCVCVFEQAIGSLAQFTLKRCDFVGAVGALCNSDADCSGGTCIVSVTPFALALLSASFLLSSSSLRYLLPSSVVNMFSFILCFPSYPRARACSLRAACLAVASTFCARAPQTSTAPRTTCLTTVCTTSRTSLWPAWL